MNENSLAHSSQKDLDLDSKPWWALILALLFAPMGLVVGTWWASHSFTLAFTELVIAFAASAAGGFLGFLFGVPRSTVENGEIENSAESNYINYRPSTNLEQVSDWLTKLLIGVGLVEFRSISDELSSLGVLVQTSVAPSFTAANVITQATVVSFLIVTFIAAFLWTRIQYGPLQMRIDKDALSGFSKKFDQIESALEHQKADTDKILKIPGMIARGELAASSAPLVQNVAAGDELERELKSWPDDVREKFKQFESFPPDWNSDPGQSIFDEGENVKDGLVLDAAVVEELPDLLVIQLRVTTQPDVTLSGVVTFLLHPTLAVPIRHVSSDNNVAETTFASQGWFTAIVIANGGGTVLSLDLRNIPGRPLWFTRK